mgnify:CR=1 FL=1
MSVEFKEELINSLVKLGSSKTFGDLYVFDGCNIDLSKIDNMVELIVYFYEQGKYKKVQQVKNVLNIIDPRV